MKKKLSNVAFGGSWSENILNEDEMSRALSVLEWAVENCTEQDVKTPELYDALDYIRGRVGKGEILCDSILSSLSLSDPFQRQQTLYIYFGLVKRWAGLL